MRRGRDWLPRLGLLVMLTLLIVGCQHEAAGVPLVAVTVEKSTPTVEPSPTIERTGINGKHYHCGPSGHVFPSRAIERLSLAWTPDGSSLVFNYASALGSKASFSPYFHTAFWVVDAKGTRLDMLIEANPFHESHHGHHADVSPNGTRIIYASCEFPFPALKQNPERADFNYEVVVVDIEGTGRQRLTRNRYLDHYPVWSPDGSRIAFISAPLSTPFYIDDDLFELFTMAPDGTDVQRVAAPGQNGLALAPPVWSDGEHIAFLANAEHFTSSLRSLFTVRADGSEMTLLAEEVVSVPAWSPNGARLTVAMFAGDHVALFTLAPDGSDLQRIATITERDKLGGAREPYWSSIHTVAWSPDGTQLLYSCDVGICLVNVEDGEVTEMEGIGRDWPGPHLAAWSPDGTRIAIYMPAIHYGGGLVELYTVARDGTDRRDLIHMEDDGTLVPANPPEDES